MAGSVLYRYMLEKDRGTLRYHRNTWRNFTKIPWNSWQACVGFLLKNPLQHIVEIKKAVDEQKLQPLDTIKERGVSLFQQ